MRDIHPVLKIWLSPVRTLRLNHLNRLDVVINRKGNAFASVIWQKSESSNSSSRYSAVHLPWECKIRLECIAKLQMVQDIKASSSDLTLSPLWNFVRVLNLLSCIRRTIVCAGIIVQMLLCSSSMIDGVFQRLCQCRQVTFEAAWFVAPEDRMKTCWGRIQIRGM